MRAFVSQRLVSTVDDKRCAAFEVLLNSPSIAELIREGDIAGIKEMMMKKSGSSGMQTFDMDLYRLYSEGEISRDVALSNADSENDLGLKISFNGGDESKDDGNDLDDLVFPE